RRRRAPGAQPDLHGAQARALLRRPGMGLRGAGLRARLQQKIPQEKLNRGLMLLLTATTFAAASGIHYQTPMLGAMAAEFGVDGAAIGWIPTLTFGGFLCGIVFLVPLGDKLDKRRLIITLVAAHFGWRAMYLIGGGLLALLAPALIARLPHTAPKTRLRYPELLASMIALVRTHAEMRRVIAIQLCLGICYGGFWATIATMLLQTHGLGPQVAGLIGIPGAAGVLIARAAGRWLDLRGAG